MEIREAEENKEKEKEEDESGDEVLHGDDILQEILNRCTTETLIRSKLVCKNWRRLICSSIAPSINGFFYWKTPEEVRFYRFLDGEETERNMDEVNSILTCLHSIAFNFNVVASHNEFVLYVIIDDYDSPKQYFLYDTLTGKEVSIPQPQEINSHCMDQVVLVCYDESKFKVYSLVHWGSNGLEVDVFSSSTRKWKRTLIPCESYFAGWTSHQFVFREHVYFWDGISEEMCLHDFKLEKTYDIEVPLNQEKYSYPEGKFGVSSNRLYFSAIINLHCFNLWILCDGYVWELKYTFNLDDSQYRCISPLTFHPSNPNLVVLTFEDKDGTRKGGLLDIEKKKIQFIQDFYHHPCSPVVSYSLAIRFHCAYSPLPYE